MRASVFFLLFFLCIQGNRAQDTLQDHFQAQNKEKFFYRSGLCRFGCERVSAITAEMRFAGYNRTSGGIGFAISSGNKGCYGGGNSGAGIACLYEWGTKTWIPSVDVWAHSYFMVMGLTCA